MGFGLRDAVYGVAVGDALGAPFESMARDTFPPVTDMMPLTRYKKPAGTWTDDTSLTLATCDSIRCQGHVDIKDMRRRFENWFFHGAYTQDGTAIGVGRTTQQAILARNGASDQMSNGNGSLMRIIPLAFVPHISEEEIAAVSAITHANSLSKAACIYYVKLAKMLRRDVNPGEAVRDAAWRTPFGDLQFISKKSRDEIRSTGYVVHTLEAAIWCIMTTSSFEEAVTKAVNLGDDTDTTAAVTGGLAGIIYGIGNIPERWIAKLRKKEMIDKVIFE